MADSHLTELSFSSLHLPEALQKGLADASFERCTPIQAQTLPQALAGMDMAGQAQTGTGKTAAFLVAMYARLMREPPPPSRNLNAPRALIIAPTRELAVQIHRDAEVLGSHTGLQLGLAFGGVDYEKQKHHLEQGVDILMGTPGRIIDFVKQKVIDLRSVQVLVLDEADRMFDLGFIADIRYILRRLPDPQARLNMLFSATLSHRVLELAYEHMNEPTLVRIEPDKMTVDRVRQVIYYPSNDEKPRLLVGLLKHMDPRRSMVFVNTRRAAEEIEGLLRSNGINAEAISGDVPQRKRLRMLRDFHEGTLACSDRHRRRFTRLAHSRCESRVQLRSAAGSGRLRPSHRPNRARRHRRRCDQLRLRGVRDFLPDIEAYIGRKLPRCSGGHRHASGNRLARRRCRDVGFGGGGRSAVAGPAAVAAAAGSRSGGGGRGGRNDRGDRRRAVVAAVHSSSRPPATEAPAACCFRRSVRRDQREWNERRERARGAAEERRRRRRSKRSNSATPGTPPAPEAT